MADKLLEGIAAAQEGATVYRKADSKEMVVTGVACTWIDNYGNRKEDVMRFVELAAQAKVADPVGSTTASAKDKASEN